MRLLCIFAAKNNIRFEVRAGAAFQVALVVVAADALDSRTEVPEGFPVTGSELIRRVNKLGKARGVAVRIDTDHGKGSHARLHFGSRFTTIKDRKQEIGPGLLAAMCKQLGIDPRDL